MDYFYWDEILGSPPPLEEPPAWPSREEEDRSVVVIIAWISERERWAGS